MMPTVDLPLRDVHLPEAVGWWPPAPGWWLLAALILVLCFFIRWSYGVLTRKTAIKTAKHILMTIRQDKTLDNLGKLTAISTLIRRVAISLAPRSEAASLTGRTWLAYLDRSVQGEPFSQGAGHYLSDAHYQKKAPSGLDIDELIALCEDWLKAQVQVKK